MVHLMQTGNVLSPTKGYQQWTRGIPRQDVHRWYQALIALPLAVTVETPAGRVGIVHCSTWRDSWSETLGALAQRNMGADPHGPARDPTSTRSGRARRGTKSRDIDRVFTGHDPHKQVERRANTWSIDTGAGFPAMNRLSLARIDVDPPTFETFEVTDTCSGLRSRPPVSSAARTPGWSMKSRACTSRSTTGWSARANLAEPVHRLRQMLNIKG